MAGEALVVLAGEGRSFPTGRSSPQVKIESAGQRSFAMFEAAQPPGVPRPPPHVHRNYDEAWYILEGTMQFILDDQTFACPAGSTVFAPRGTAHTFMNLGPVPARMLAITTAEALSLVEDLGRLTGAGPPDMKAVGEIMDRHDTYFAGPPPAAEGLR